MASAMLAEHHVERQLEAEIVARPGERRVGVIFVHGVGSQLESSTVREFGEPLLKWLEAWHTNENVRGFSVPWSRLSYGEHPAGPARFAVRIPRDGPRAAETWIVAEAWWAARLEAPSLRTMISWSGSIFLQFLGRLRYQATQRSDRTRGSLASRVIERLNALVLLAGYALAAVAGYPLLGILFLLAQVPWQPLEEFILVRLLRPLLVDNIGDFYVYMYDEIQSRHIRRSVLEAVRWLTDEERCEHVVVVGHSQGAVVSGATCRPRSAG